jgi:4-coumarate--CoA ligase
MNIGGAVAAIDHTSDVESTVSCLKTVDAKIIIAHPDTLDRAIKAAEIAGITTENVFVLGKNDIDGTRCVENAFWDHEELAVPVTYTKEELATTPCYYYFTSGTTGKKKAVVLT